MYAQNTTFVGLDVHKKNVVVALLRPGAEKPEDLGGIDNTARALRRLAKRLLKQAPGPIVACYEAGPCGYEIQRLLLSLGLQCLVVAPSLIPVKPGDHVKTDRRDARHLALCLRANQLTEVHPPSPAEEAVRDLTRAREDAKQDEMRARHRLSKFALRHGHTYREGGHWTRRHLQWLRALDLGEPSATVVRDHYMLVLEQATERVEHLTRKLDEVAHSEPYAERVGWLRCMRGVDTVIAMTVLAELHDFRRFTCSQELMSYLGLTPSEHSSGESKRRGAITKAGNGHVRRMLIQAAWSYRYRPHVSIALKKRRQGQPGRPIAIADKAQQRLHDRYRKLKARGKHHNVVVTAVARELVGFIWSILQSGESPPGGAEQGKPSCGDAPAAKTYRLQKR